MGKEEILQLVGNTLEIKGESCGYKSCMEANAGVNESCTNILSLVIASLNKNFNCVESEAPVPKNARLT
jgi:hypothetical protein